ncbi:MAG: hypothetical protein R2874_06445 [Desulfobacterales bacterium]
MGAISRLLDMGVEGFLLSSTLLGVLAQRLVRVICENCKEPVAPDEKHLSAMGLSEEDIEGVTFYNGKGCESCATPVFGRTALLNTLRLTQISAMKSQKIRFRKNKNHRPGKRAQNPASERVGKSKRRGDHLVRSPAGDVREIICRYFPIKPVMRLARW